MRKRDFVKQLQTHIDKTAEKMNPKITANAIYFMTKQIPIIKTNKKIYIEALKEIKTYLKKHFHIKVKEEGIVPMGSLENIPEEIKAKPIINKGDENFGKTIEEFVLADPNPNYLARKGHGLFNKPDYYIVKVTEGRGKKVLNAKKVKSF